MLGSLVFLTPAGGLAALAVALPLLALVLAARREQQGRELLGLLPPPPISRLPRALALLAVPALLGLGATQPALRSTTKARVRTDAQAFFVLDISRSMLAAAGPKTRTRLTRAKSEAIAIRDALPEVPSGIATMTDRVLPDLLPSPDASVFTNTLEHAVAIEQPSPSDTNVVATSLGALGALGTQNFFPPAATRRLVVVLTDGESRPFDARATARALAAGRGAKLVVVHVWAPGEAVYDRGQLEQGYHEDPASGQEIATLTAAAGGSAFAEHSIGAAIRKAKADLGTGPTVVQGQTERTRTLAPYVLLAALLPLLLVVRGSAGRKLGPALTLLARELIDCVPGSFRRRVLWPRRLGPGEAGGRPEDGAPALR